MIKINRVYHFPFNGVCFLTKVIHNMFLVLNWNYFEMRLLNLRIIYLFIYLLQTFCPHLGSFCVVSSFTTFRPNFTSGLLQVINRDIGEEC